MANMARIPGMMRQRITPPRMGGAGGTSGSTMPGLPKPPTMPQGQEMRQQRVGPTGLPAQPSRPTGRPPGMDIAGMMLNRARGR